MEKIIKIHNMSCEHCASKVESTLKAVPGVESVKVSLFRKRAVVKGENLSDEALSKAVTDAGYEVVSVE